MGRLLLLASVELASCVLVGCGDADHWSRIEPLLKNGTARGNPELAKYLSSLTQDQMLSAARQCSRAVERTVPPTDWGPAVADVGLVLAFYEGTNGADIDKGDLDPQASSLPDESLNKLLAIVGNRREGDFFRFALAHMLYGSYREHLNETQKGCVVTALSAVLCDGKSSKNVREQSCHTLRGLLEEAYTRVIYRDPAMRELRTTGPPERWRNAFSLIDKGEIRLTEATPRDLSPLRRRIKDFRELLAAIVEDNREPVDLRTLAQSCLDSTGKLPLLDVPRVGRP